MLTMTTKTQLARGAPKLSKAFFAAIPSKPSRPGPALFARSSSIFFVGSRTASNCPAEAFLLTWASSVHTLARTSIGKVAGFGWLLFVLESETGEFFNTAISRSNARRGTGRRDWAGGGVITGESISLPLDADTDAELGVTSAGSGANIASNTRLPVWYNGGTSTGEAWIKANWTDRRNRVRSINSKIQPLRSLGVDTSCYGQLNWQEPRQKRELIQLSARSLAVVVPQHPRMHRLQTRVIWRRWPPLLSLRFWLQRYPIVEPVPLSAKDPPECLNPPQVTQDRTHLWLYSNNY